MARSSGARRRRELYGCSMRIFDPFGKAVDDAWGLHMDQTNGLHMPLELPKTPSQKFPLHLRRAREGAIFPRGYLLKVFTAQLVAVVCKLQNVEKREKNLCIYRPFLVTKADVDNL